MNEIYRTEQGGDEFAHMMDLHSDLVTFRFEVRAGIGRLHLPGQMQPIIVTETRPVALKISRGYWHDL